MSEQYSANIPNNTIYINNLQEKVKLLELKKSLYAIFSQFGKILDVVAAKNFWARGQAFVVFEDVTSSTNALRSMQGFPFYDKPMRIAFAKSKSDAISKMDGTYADRKRKRLEKGKAPKRIPPSANKMKAVATPQILIASQQPVVTFPAAQMQYSVAQPLMQADIINKILFITNLPQESTKEMVETLFNRYPGYLEVRLVPGRSDIAFVEFDSENNATTSKTQLDKFQIKPGHCIRVTYAKRD